MTESHAAFDNDIERYGTYQYTDGSTLSEQLAGKRMSQIISSAISFKGKSILDVGCGDGTYSASLFADASPSTILGLDPSEKAINRAAEKYSALIPSVKFLCGTSEELIKKGLFFDVAIYRGVLHHLPNPSEELNRAFRLAQTVVITEPNGLNPLMRAMNLFSPYHREHQEKSFFPSTLKKWIVQGGGRVIYSKFFAFVPHFCPKSITRMAFKLEPYIENIPIIRNLCCGQLLIVTSKTAS